MATYKGFSSISKLNRFRLTDFDLIKQDLYNHLYTKPGERLMNPKFGCIIWNLLYEPLDDIVRKTMTDSLISIIAAEPRVIADSIILTSYENGIMVQIELRYKETNETYNMLVSFDQQTAKLQ